MRHPTRPTVGRHGSSARRFSFEVDPQPCQNVAVSVRSNHEELAIKAIVPSRQPVSDEHATFIQTELRRIQRKHPADFGLSSARSRIP